MNKNKIQSWPSVLLENSLKPSAPRVPYTNFFDWEERSPFAAFITLPVTLAGVILVAFLSVREPIRRRVS